MSVLFAVLTGLRRGEIIGLCWQNIDFQNALLTIESSATFHSKMGKRRTIPLSGNAMEILKKIRKTSKTKNVFTINGTPLLGNTIAHIYKRYARMAGLREELNFHALRHSHGSWLAISGASIYKISKLLGHSDVKVTQTHYAHLQPENLRDTVDLISF